MSGYDQIVKIKAEYYESAISFLDFVNRIGKRYSRHVIFSYKYLKRGRFKLTVDGQSGSIDAILQELILNRGLYYYACTLEDNSKGNILKESVIPLYQQLLEERFPNTYGKFLGKHIVGSISQYKYIPGDFFNQFSHEYEIIFRKWDIGIIDNWNFIKDVDSFLNHFLLVTVGHVPTQKSPKFNVLLEKAFKIGIGMEKDTKKIFNTVHSKRTGGLHRLNTNFSKEKINELAMRIYGYFQYYEEFQESQKEKLITLHGKKYKRIRYGSELLKGVEQPVEVNGVPVWWSEMTKSNHCHDCFAIFDQLHCSGCDVEECPRCGGQLLSCDCQLLKDI